MKVRCTEGLNDALDEPLASLLLAARVTFAQEEREGAAQSNVDKNVANGDGATHALIFWILKVML
jgi:hypothetical protein